MNLDGKIAFITGGGIAQACFEKGMKVVLADIDLNHAQAQVEPFGANGLALKLDVTSLESWKAAREAAVWRFGAIDVIRNNVSISQPHEPPLNPSPDFFACEIANPISSTKDSPSVAVDQSTLNNQ